MLFHKMSSNQQSLTNCIILGTLLFCFMNLNPVYGQCPNDDACDDVCGVQGNGTCVAKRLGSGKFCSCDGCPTRSLEELLSPHLCTLDPICQLNCPMPSLKRTYWGHTCLSGFKPVCVCFCLPMTPQSIIDTITCPFRSQQQQ